MYLYLLANPFFKINVPVLTRPQFYEIMEFFLRPENASIWAEVQSLAARDDDAGLHAYVAEAQRLTSTQRNVRVATAPADIEGKKIAPGDLVVMLLVSHILLLLPIPSQV